VTHKKKEKKMKEAEIYAKIIKCLEKLQAPEA
jgi:hypothetical protein